MSVATHPGSAAPPRWSLLTPMPHVLEVRAHHAGERALVGEGQRRVAELPGALHQFAGVRGPGEEAEVAAAMQLGITRQAGPAAGRRCGGYGAIGVGR